MDRIEFTATLEGIGKVGGIPDQVVLCEIDGRHMLIDNAVGTRYRWVGTPVDMEHESTLTFTAEGVEAAQERFQQALDIVQYNLDAMFKGIYDDIVSGPNPEQLERARQREALDKMQAELDAMPVGFYDDIIAGIKATADFEPFHHVTTRADILESRQAYAEALGKDVEFLTKTERGLAFVNHIMDMIEPEEQEPELLPCPFCGGELELVCHQKYLYTTKGHGLVCPMQYWKVSADKREVALRMLNRRAE